jgi:photosystem II stability/assembly factor-like uncharacterized protein
MATFRRCSFLDDVVLDGRVFWADLYFVDALTGFVVGPGNGYNNTDHVYRTDDGGRTWRVLQFAPSG